MLSSPVAVIDIGSNSGRVVVYAIAPEANLRILASSRASLRLVRQLDRTNSLSPAAIERAMEALRDFRAITIGSGARRTLAVATSAVRDADNGPAFIDRVRRELGIHMQILSGAEEAHYGCLGAIRGLAVKDGVLFDVGGGSMQLSQFRARRPGRGWSFPLGALRLSDVFLASDPPSSRERRRLVEHVARVLTRAAIAPLARGAALVGTGGTVRNLAKIDQRQRAYPIPRLHGYVLARHRVREIVTMLASRSQKRRSTVAGLNDDRADSIVGGGLAILTLMEALDSDEVHVSGQGVREGLAVALVTDRVPPPPVVRRASIGSLCAAFSEWDAAAAERRAAIADALYTGLEEEPMSELREALGFAATVLDVGRSIDYFDRHEHVAEIVLATDLLGFEHRQVALLSAVLRSADDEGAELAQYEPLLDDDDRAPVDRAATLLALADDIEARCRDDRKVSVRCRVVKRRALVTVPGLLGWRPRRIGPRFERAFGRALEVSPRP
jgi:exopolyphosphatase / guanosine-5'-triphosphate,3'-diphosphate pyrophosphatase